MTCHGQFGIKIDLLKHTSYNFDTGDRICFYWSQYI